MTVKQEELRQKENSELLELLDQSREKLRQLRFDLASGKVKNVAEIKETKKTIARILTILKERELKNSKIHK
ncbi:MAG TPA: 50S ribosomal protein L29 [Candidatus Parcubacteria bacterium]|nr:50S ribosomal protein L29 [Candidatus Parcubacteria bacterium]